MRTFRWLPFLRAFVILAGAMVILTGCEDDIVFNQENSINIATPGPEWPKNRKKLTADQQAIFAKYGRPDFMRLLWNPEGRIVDRTELRAEMKGKKKAKTLPPMNWVYITKGVEVSFAGGPQEKPLNDETRLVCRYGDPELVKQLPGGVTQWTFYSTGKLYNMSQGKIMSEKSFPAMGSFRGK